MSDTPNDAARTLADELNRWADVWGANGSSEMVDTMRAAAAALAAERPTVEDAIVEAFKVGYERGHHDTVESEYGDPTEAAYEYAAEVGAVRTTDEPPEWVKLAAAYVKDSDDPDAAAAYTILRAGLRGELGRAVRPADAREPDAWQVSTDTPPQLRLFKSKTDAESWLKNIDGGTLTALYAGPHHETPNGCATRSDMKVCGECSWKGPTEDLIQAGLSWELCPRCETPVKGVPNALSNPTSNPLSSDD